MAEDQEKNKMEEYLAKTKGQIDAWADQTTKDLDQMKAEHIAQRSKGQANIEKLKVQEQESISKAAAVRERAEKETQQIDAQMQQIDELRKAEDDYPPQIREVQRKIDAEKRRIQEQGAELAKLETVHRERKLELERGLDFYSDRLGLKFERTGDDRLNFTFSQIDAQSPEKPFAFSIYINETDQYELDSCEPMVAGTDEALADVNRNNDFALFVKTMRKLFLASLS